VSRQAIHKALKAGEVVTGGGGVDPAHPTNKAYLVRALARAAGHPERIPKPPVVKAAAKKAPAEKPGSGKAGKKNAAGKPEGGPKAEGVGDALQALIAATGLDSAEDREMMKTIAQKAYWDTLKVKEDVLKRQLDRAREVGSVIDQRMIESLVGTLHQALQGNFVDAPQKQAIQICQMLGADGKENQVMLYLEKDNERRLKESDRALESMVRVLVKRMQRRRKAA